MRVLNLGAGVQSTTIALMGREPDKYPLVGKIDYAIFADTQEEPTAVYSHLDWLEKEVPFPILRRTAGKLGDDLISGIPPEVMGYTSTSYMASASKMAKKRYISIPAFLSGPSQKAESVIPRNCTRHYKIDVIDKTIRREILGLKKGQRVPPTTEVEQLFGLSYDEAGRIIRVKAAHQFNPFKVVFPLFEMEMTRRSCESWLIRQSIPHKVTKSACVFCPYRTNSQLRDLKENHPKDWARAVYVDLALRDFELVPKPNESGFIPFTHKSCVPLHEADLDDPETKERKRGQEMFGFVQECEGMCGV
jgi:hypothetical protein